MMKNARHFSLLLFLCSLVFPAFEAQCQVRILSSSFSTFNVSAESMCNINISGGTAEYSGTIEARITDALGKEIIKVTSNAFALKNGIFNSSQSGVKVNSISYQTTAISDYIKLYHQLPSGKYTYAVLLKLSDGTSDELTEDIESESSSFLSLVNPPDKDTIENPNPLLIWTHQESFNVIQQGEYFRILVCEINGDQNAEAALSVNSPILQQNFLSRHDVLYPNDATKLISGKKYGWQVQKVVNGVITNKTEAWQFSIKDSENYAKNFIEMTPKLNANPYEVLNHKLYFVFNEEYGIQAKELEVSVIDSKGKEEHTIAKNSMDEKHLKDEFKDITNNRYVLDLQELNLKNGVYVLKIRNKKNEEFLLKFKYSL